MTKSFYWDAYNAQVPDSEIDTRSVVPEEDDWTIPLIMDEEEYRQWLRAEAERIAKLNERLKSKS